MLKWISSYIDNRTQAVIVNNYISGLVPIPIGVLQGSLIVPLLLAVCLYDVDTDLLSSKLLCFAYDIKVYTTVLSIGDAMVLQKGLYRLQKYCYDHDFMTL